jgi:G:T-mismatch repair DNA endonuclease (very short patch repair protein)
MGASGIDTRIADWPRQTSTKKDWDKSFARQVRRDQYVLNELLNAGWRVLIAWECAVSEQKAPKDLRKKSLQEMVNWLESDEKFAEIRRPAD